MSTLSGQRWVVMGLGAFGGGMGVVRHLLGRGATVHLTDRQSEADLAQPIGRLRAEFPSRRLTFRLGEHRRSDFEQAQAIVVNPAVPSPWSNRFVTAAAASGARIETEITLALPELAHLPTIAVTGTAGKSTTTAAIGHALTSLGRHPIVGGNLGGSLLDHLEFSKGADALVVELSSAQLYWIDRVLTSGFRPTTTAVTNLMPNHLDWHGSSTEYERCKRTLPMLTAGSGTAVLGAAVADWAVTPGAQRAVVTAGLSGAALPGTHNATNLAMAAAVVRSFLAAAGFDASRDAINNAVRSFPGLPHRLQRVSSACGAAWYDDSKSTVPEATLLAVEAVSERTPLHRIHLISGGYDKGVDLSAISVLASDIAGLYTIGATGDTIASAAPVNAMSCETLDAAVHLIAERLCPGDAVLLSPGCASWDQFPNFEVRGSRFAELAKETAGTHAEVTERRTPTQTRRVDT